MGHPDYPLQEFANNLANVEEKYAKEIQGLVECFCGSRVDLPIKKLDELAKAKIKTAKHLRKCEDKRGELYTLWKLCNIYSAVAVDVDEAMRDIRGTLRKKIKSPGQKDPSPFRKIIDEYRPANKQRAPEPPAEVYDTVRPSLRDKVGFRFWKKESRKNAAVQDVDQDYPAPLNLAEAVKANYRSEEKPSVLPPKPPSIPPITQPEPSFAPVITVPPTEKIPAAKAFEMIDGPASSSPAVRIRTAATKNKVEEAKRLSMPPVLSESEKTKNASLPPVAPPRKEKTETSTAKRDPQQGKNTPALPPRPKDETWKKGDMTKVQPTVIQLDGRVPAPQTLQYQQFSSTNPFAAAAARTGKVENATNIQVEDALQPTIPPSPQTTIRIRSTPGDAAAMSPKVGNDRVQKFQPESIPGRPVQQARIIFNTGTSVDRF